jgi:hypothetical protein
VTITDAMVEAALNVYAAGIYDDCDHHTAMRRALEAAYPQARDDKIRVALEKARRLHQIDCADHNVGLFIDEALSWLTTTKT